MPDSELGSYLRDRRARLDPAALGLPSRRRRTPGLRREEVAARANISATWYTWLEQGRGGAPSADVLDRIARALLLTDPERAHLYLIGLGRPPEVTYRPSEGITPRLQRVLDAMPESPALIRNLTWDVLAWNAAASRMLTAYATLPPGERNTLRRMFCDPATRAAQLDWEGTARHMVATLRADVARLGAAESVAPFVEDLCARSPDFAALWRQRDVEARSEGVKGLSLPGRGELRLEYSSFAVEGRPDLSMLVFNPLDAG